MSADEPERPVGWPTPRTGPPVWGADPPPRPVPPAEAAPTEPAETEPEPDDEVGEEDAPIERDPDGGLASDQLHPHRPARSAEPPREDWAPDPPSRRPESWDPSVHGRWRAW